MKYYPLRIIIGILTFLVGVSLVTYWYFKQSSHVLVDRKHSTQTTQMQTDDGERPIPSEANKPKILFTGEKIEVVEEEQSNFEQNPLNNKSAPESELCFQKIEKKIKNKLSGLGFNGNTKYFKFDWQDNASNNKPFILKVNKEQSAKLNLEFIKKLDTDSTYCDSCDLYFIKNESHEYLLLIGHASATSGVGHYYRNHTLIPLDAEKPIVEFDSVFSDPRKIKIDDSGMIYYTRIEDKTNFGSAYDVDWTYFPVTASAFIFDKTSNKIFEFNFTCKSSEMF